MAYRCWTCGSSVEKLTYTCPFCREFLKELQTLRHSAASVIDIFSRKPDTAGTEIKEGVNTLHKSQQEGFNLLRDKFSGHLAAAASCIEWGFGDIEWKIFQQTEVLQNLEHILNTPGQVQSNEWRIMAEELRQRGVLEESEEFFLKAIDINRLDYRLYIGLAITYLQNNQFEQAQKFLEKSLPHAPVQEMDYKSYSYRLLGHIYTCEKNYTKAATALHSAITLSPDYLDGCYDYAQYAALIGKKEESLAWLRKAIQKPLYFSLAQQEINLDSIHSDIYSFFFRIALTGAISSEYNDGIFELAKYWMQVGNIQSCLLLLNQLIKSDSKFFALIQGEEVFATQEIQQFLQKLTTEAFQNATHHIHEAEHALTLAKDIVTDVAAIFKGSYMLKSSTLYNNAETKLQLARRSAAFRQYAQYLEAVPLAGEAQQLFHTAREEALKERETYVRRRSGRHRHSRRRNKKHWQNISKFIDSLSKFFFWPVIMGAIFATATVFLAFFVVVPWSLFFAITFVGVLIGLLIGVKEEGKKIKRFFR